LPRSAEAGPTFKLDERAVLLPKVEATKGTVTTSAVESRTWGSSRWCMAFKNSSHKQ
jgi:hypothetical protein